MLIVALGTVAGANEPEMAKAGHVAIISRHRSHPAPRTTVLGGLFDQNYPVVEASLKSLSFSLGSALTGSRAGSADYATARDKAHCDQSDDTASARCRMSSSVCSGVGVMRRRSVPTGTVG